MVNIESCTSFEEDYLWTYFINRLHDIHCNNIVEHVCATVIVRYNNIITYLKS